jgi:hypothetical protein
LKQFLLVISCLALWPAALLLPANAAELDLRNARVLAVPGLSRQEQKAVTMLTEEIEKRTRIRLPVTRSWPEATVPVLAIGPSRLAKDLAGPFADHQPRLVEASGAEGYRLYVKRQAARAPAVFVLGNDARGVLFGVGRLLREMHLERDRIALDDDLHVATVPKYPLRGHQLGYRPKTNSYDGWTVALWEQYIRDLAVFGTNAVELIPPRSDDDADSPHFPLPPMDMMVAMSCLLDDYGLDAWIWYPAMDANYADPKTVELALGEWAEVFRKLPRVDAVFVPGGDPGHTPPRVLLALLKKQTESLHRYHPRAQMWVSPQSFSQAWLDEFCLALQKEQPHWLSGVVYGPQVRISLPELRRRIPEQCPIRRYPDITHSLRCQYPVPDWDIALARTEGRECINPRPRGQAQIFRRFQSSAVGFITYSEGCNDDVNKIVWSSLGWDPAADVVDILRQYSRYFIGPRYQEGFAQGLVALERNWQGALLTNQGVDTTLEQFRAMEQAASPPERLNWRFQQALYRAYYDAYERQRLIYETELEQRACERLRQVPRTGSLAAVSQAEAILNRAVSQPVAEDLRARVFELGEALFQSIRMQLSVPRYQAIDVGRGANLDTIDVPLNNGDWLKQQFARVRRLGSEADRLKAIDAVLNWTNPGPGGFYDDLGNPLGHPHLVKGEGFDNDPAFLHSALVGFHGARGWRQSWCRHAESLFDAPLSLHYRDLDPKAHYRVRVVYTGDSMRVKLRLVANEQMEIHSYLAKPDPPERLEFDLPHEATEKGTLTLTWSTEPGRGGNGRGCQVAEVWLIKKMIAARVRSIRGGCRCTIQATAGRAQPGPATSIVRAAGCALESPRRSLLPRAHSSAARYCSRRNRAD